MTRRKAWAVLVCSMALLACGEEQDSGPRFTVTDSAGIVVATSQSPRWGRVTVSDPLFQFGVMSGPEHLMFDRVAGVTRLEDGRLAVGNGGTNTVRIFRESGELLDEFGGEGEGPGEFRYIRGVRRCESGRITTFDYNWHRVVFDLEGELVQTGPVALPGEPGPYLFSCDAEGGVLATGWGTAFAADRPMGNYRAEASIFVSSSGNAPFRTLGTTPIDDRFSWAEGGGPLPFGRRSVIAHAKGGFVLGTAEAYGFTVLSMDGDTTLLVRWLGPERLLKDAHVAAYLSARLEDASEADHPHIREEVRQIQMPDSLPPYSEVQVDPSGVVWLKEFTPPGQSGPSRWWGFLPTGEWAWELELEPGFQVLEFGVDEVLGVVRDEFGVEAVRGYRLALPRDSI